MKAFRMIGGMVLIVTLTACDVITAIAELATLNVANQTHTPVEFMYISACSESGWGSDQLGPSELIPSGSVRSWTLDAGCYDVRAVFTDNEAVEDHLEISAGTTFTWELTE